MSSAVAIVAGSMIGTGVFTSLGFQVGAIPSGFPVMLLWFLGGVLAFCGAAAYAELSTALPGSGGEYTLLSRIYHPLVGFLSGWVSFTVGFPAPVAAAALVFGHTLCVIAGADPTLLAPALAVGLIVCLTGVHLISVSFSGKFQLWATAAKVTLIAAMAMCGFLLPERQQVSFLPAVGDGALIMQTSFAISLMYVVYAYSGWNSACYVAGEVERPQRNLPRALFTGTALVTLLYVGLNAAMLNAAPISALANQEGVAAISAEYIFGQSGGAVVSLLIGLGLVSSVSAMMWAGPRVTQKMGEDYPILSFLAHKNQGGVPVGSILLQGLLACVLACLGTVEQIISTTSYLLQLAGILAVTGVFVLRRKAPELERPYRAWGHPFTTGIYLLFSVWILAGILLERPAASKAGTVLLIVGTAFYVIANSSRQGPEKQPRNKSRKSLW